MVAQAKGRPSHSSEAPGPEPSLLLHKSRIYWCAFYLEPSMTVASPGLRHTHAKLPEARPEFQRERFLWTPNIYSSTFRATTYIYIANGALQSGNCVQHAHCLSFTSHHFLYSQRELLYHSFKDHGQRTRAIRNPPYDAVTLFSWDYDAHHAR